MRTHHLKTWPGPFAALLDGSKTFELRFDDRAYAIGDVLVLKEYDPAKECTLPSTCICRYTGRVIRKVVTYRCATAEWIDGARGWVVLGLGNPDDSACGACAAVFDETGKDLGCDKHPQRAA